MSLTSLLFIFQAMFPLILFPEIIKYHQTLFYLLFISFVLTLVFSPEANNNFIQALSTKVTPKTGVILNNGNSQHYDNADIERFWENKLDNFEQQLEKSSKEIDRKHKNAVQKCCTNGQKYADYQKRCDSVEWNTNSKYLGSINECSMFWNFCCFEQLILSQCKSGINSFKQERQECSNNFKGNGPNSFTTSTVSFECCSACKLGFRWSSWDHDDISTCTVQFYRSIQSEPLYLTLEFQLKLEETFVDCCNQSKFETIKKFNRNLNDKQEINEKLPILAKLTEAKTNESNKFCGNGYEYNPSSPTRCTDIDECDTGRYECETPNVNCINTVGSYYCSKCKAGFRLRTSEEQSQFYYGSLEMSECVDVNECQGNPCLPGQSCMNVVGSYKCFCQVGYQMDSNTGECKDINECQLGTHNCHETLRCDNTVGSFHCVRVQDCGTGYTINADRDICEDIDECTLGIHDCGPEFQCRNTQGTFKCDRISCPQNQQLIHGMCKNVECPNGKQFDYLIGRCVNTDPCNKNHCSSSEQCQALPSVPGSTVRYQCVENCSPGYQLEKKLCVDIDECATGMAECALNQRCINLKGHYDCECVPGFQMDSNRNCNDIDECQLGSQNLLLNCPYPMRCTNTIGSYRCDQCHAGYRMTSDGSCIDIDECSEQTEYELYNGPVCHHLCLNTPGSFKCECRTGFKLSDNNRTCIDIDECLEFSDNSSKQTTFSTRINRFTNGIKQSQNKNLCVGICVNTIGSFECNCPNGFRRVNGHCIDINECLEKKITCNNKDESCINVLGNFKCIPIRCPVGYKKFAGYKSIQCIKSGNYLEVLDADQFNQYSYLYYSLYNNQTNLLRSDSGYRFYATRLGDSNTSSSTGYGTYFDLKFVSSTNSKTSLNHFRLEKRSSNEATISILKPLPGPQTVQLELVILGYKKSAYYRQKVHFTIDVSQYSLM